MEIKMKKDKTYVVGINKRVSLFRHKVLFWSNNYFWEANREYAKFMTLEKATELKYLASSFGKQVEIHRIGMSKGRWLELSKVGDDLKEAIDKYNIDDKTRG